MQSTSKNPLAAAELLRAQIDREDAARQRDRLLEIRGHQLSRDPGASSPNRHYHIRTVPPTAALSGRCDAPGAAAPNSPHSPDSAPQTPASPSPLRPFKPTPEQSELLLTELAADDLTLRDIAEKFHTTLDALNLWLMRPDIDARLTAISSVCAKRTRLIAANRSVHIARILGRLLDAHDEFESLELIQPDATPPEAKQRARESVRKACSLFLRLNTFHPERRTRPAPSPKPTTESETSPERSEGPSNETSPEPSEGPSPIHATNPEHSEGPSPVHSACPPHDEESPLAPAPTPDPTEPAPHSAPQSLKSQISDPDIPAPTPDLHTLRESRLHSPPLPRSIHEGTQRSAGAEGTRAPLDLTTTSPTHPPLRLASNLPASHVQHSPSALTPVTISAQRARPP